MFLVCFSSLFVCWFFPVSFELVLDSAFHCSNPQSWTHHWDNNRLQRQTCTFNMNRFSSAFSYTESSIIYININHLFMPIWWDIAHHRSMQRHPRDWPTAEITKRSPSNLAVPVHRARPPGLSWTSLISHTGRSVYAYIYIYMCVCVCVIKQYFLDVQDAIMSLYLNVYSKMLWLATWFISVYDCLCVSRQPSHNANTAELPLNAWGLLITSASKSVSTRSSSFWSSLNDQDHKKLHSKTWKPPIRTL